MIAWTDGEGGRFEETLGSIQLFCASVDAEMISNTRHLSQLLLFVGVSLGLTGFSQATAQNSMPLPVDEALNVSEFPSLTPIALSPDSKWLAYTVQSNQRERSMSLEAFARTGAPAWISGTDIHLLNVETGEDRDLTKGNGDSWLPAWSPDGQQLAFLSTRDSGGQARLWVWSAINGALRKVSDVNLRTDQIEWTADSQRLLVTVAPEGPRGEVAPMIRPSRAESEKDSPNKVPGATAVLYKSDHSAPGDEAVVKSDPWNLDRYLRDLCSIDVGNGDIRTLVHGSRIAGYLISPLGLDIAYTIPERFEKPGSQQTLFGLGVVNLSNGEGRIVASGIRLGYDGLSFSWSPDASHLSFETWGMDEQAYDCYVVDARRGAPRNVTMQSRSKATQPRPWPPLWDTKGRIYFLRDGELWRTSIDQGNAQRVGRVAKRTITRMIPQSQYRLWTSDASGSTVVVTHDDVNKRDGFYKIDLESGQATRLLEDDQCYTCANVAEQFTVTDDGKQVVYFAEDARHEEELTISDAGFEHPRLLTNLNPQFKKYKMGSVQLIHWLGDDGEQLRGAVLLPSDYHEGRRYPLIVWVYGNDLPSDRLDRFGLTGIGPFNLQLLATRGYAVLLPDAPQHLGTPLLDLAKTVLQGVNAVIEMGIADPDRLGVMGHSYGGYATLSLIVQTNRFKAAVDIDGFGDMVGDYGAMGKDGTAFGTSIDEQGQGLMGGTPWEFRDRYIENSPIFYLDRVDTPLLIIHGSNDAAVPSFLGDEVFVALRRLGKEAQYAKYEGESHSPYQWSYANQLDLCSRMIAWFEEHLKERTH